MTNHLTVLLDGDIPIVRSAAKHQQEISFDPDDDPYVTVNKEQAIADVDKYIAEVCEVLRPDDLLVVLSDSNRNWRKELFPEYKSGRPPKPILVSTLREYVCENYTTKEKPSLEADDTIGILATHPSLIKGDRIMVSEDKDFLTIPGWLFNPAKHKTPVYVTEEDANAFHLYQTLVGDTTDGYKGCPGVGHVAATEALSFCSSWDSVLSTYLSKGLTEEDALMQGRMARICRYTEYDFKNQEVRLWQPPKK